MTGGLINIISYGTDDLFLTGSPEITLFKFVYRRYTNFSKESVPIIISNLNFGETVEVEILKNGDLISKTFLEIVLPKIQIPKINMFSDITSDEENTLNNLYSNDPPFYYQGINKIDMDFPTDFSTFKTYLKVNIEGLRTAKKNLSIYNQTVIQYINSILTAINTMILLYPNILTDTEIMITNDFNYEMYQKNYTNARLLDFNFSDISYTLNIILNGIIISQPEYLSMTIDDVYNSVQNCINNCQSIFNYYSKTNQSLTEKENDNNSEYAKFAWVDKIGHAIIDYIEIQIGGESIDKHYGDWINLWYELTSNENQKELYNKMIGNIPELTSFDRNEKPQHHLYIPLKFWFCSLDGLAFPLIALQYNKFNVIIKLKNLEDCSYIEKLPTVDKNGDDTNFNNILGITDIWNNMNYSLNSNLWVDYVYLDTLERKRFSQSSHEYLVSTVEMDLVENVSDNKQVIEMNFTGLSRELIFVCQKQAYTDNYNTDENKSNLKNLWFNYTTDVENGKNPLSNIRIIFNGYDRFYSESCNHTNYLIPFKHHSNTPNVGINNFCFALFPEEHQPSGSCNFTRLPNSILKFMIDKKMFQYYLSDIDPNVKKNTDEDILKTTTINIRIYSSKLNILRVSHGRSALAYH